MKHTPGTWKIGKNGNGSAGWDVYAPDDSEHSTDGDVRIVAGYCTETNAHLIAAAPDMLEALETIIVNYLNSELHDVNIAVEAIRKAKGE